MKKKTLYFTCVLKRFFSRIIIQILRLTISMAAHAVVFDS